LTFTLVFAGVVTLVTSAYELRKYVFGGESRLMVEGLVSESAESISRPWPPGSHWYAARVAYETRDGTAQSEWVYGLEAPLPVGSPVLLGYNQDDPRSVSTAEQLASKREDALWFPLVGLGLLGLAWLTQRGGRAGAHPTSRHLPSVLITALVMVSMLPGLWVEYFDQQWYQQRYVSTAGVVVGSERCGFISASRMALHCEQVAWQLDGVQRITLGASASSAAANGTPRTVLYDPVTREHAFVMGKDPAPSLMVWFVVAVPLLGLLLMLLLVRWYRDARAKRGRTATF